MQENVEKTIEFNATVDRVWQAITDYKEFSAWFRVDLENPFVLGQVSAGQMTYPGHEHLRWEAQVVNIEPKRLFAIEWCPLAVNLDIDFADQPKTLVEFRLEAIPGGTRLTITESGFDCLPDDAERNDALRRNSEGWDIQVQNIIEHVHA